MTDAGDGDGGGGPFWDHIGTILEPFWDILEHKQNTFKNVCFNLFCLVAALAYPAGDGEGVGDQLYYILKYLFIYIYIYILYYIYIFRSVYIKIHKYIYYVI